MKAMRKLVLLTMVLFSSVLLTLGQECGAGETLINHADAQAGKITTASGGSAQKGVVLYGFYNSYSCTTQAIAYIVDTVDSSSSNYYGFAIIDTSGNVVFTTAATVGTQFSPAAGAAASLPWTASGTLPVGQFFLAVGTTCSASCATLWGDVGFGEFYWAIAPDTSLNTPWTFSSSGFSGFSSTNVPVINLTLSSSATQTVSGSGCPGSPCTAQITVTQATVSHVYPGAYITVSGVTTSGATALNCTNCAVTAVSPSTSQISYTTTGASFSGTINSVPVATMTIPPSLPATAGFTPPTVMYY
jgi:hypothetical protein